MADVRPIKEIQARLMSAADELRATVKQLGLVDLMTELERNYPHGMNFEEVSEGEIPPPLAWEVHADVGNAKILLEDVLQSLEAGSRKTEQVVRQQWLEDKLREVKDVPTRSLLAELARVFLEREGP